VTEFTDQQLEDGIVSALGEGNIKAVEGILRLLAVQNPARAAVMLDTLKLSIEIAREAT